MSLTLIRSIFINAKYNSETIFKHFYCKECERFCELKDLLIVEERENICKIILSNM